MNGRDDDPTLWELLAAYAVVASAIALWVWLLVSVALRVFT